MQPSLGSDPDYLNFVHANPPLVERANNGTVHLPPGALFDLPQQAPIEAVPVRPATPPPSYRIEEEGRRITLLQGNSDTLAALAASYPQMETLIIMSFQETNLEAVEAALETISFPNLLFLDVSAPELPTWLANVITRSCGQRHVKVQIGLL